MKSLTVSAAFVFFFALRPVSATDLTLDRQLIVACYSRDVDAVVMCLRKGANVNARFGSAEDEVMELFINRWDGGMHLAAAWTPLIALAASNDLPDPPRQFWEELTMCRDAKRIAEIQRSISQDLVDQRQANSMAILRILLSHGCLVDAEDRIGTTALYKAADASNIPMAKLLLESGANPNTKTGIFIDGAENKTPLHVACPSQEMMQLLLDHGADASAKDSEGRTPADWLSWYSDRTFDLVKTADGWRIQSRK